MLLSRGDDVVGIDNLNDSYDVRIKGYRLNQLKARAGEGQFTFERGDIENIKTVNELFDRHHFDGVLNLAARAGVRYSLENPHVYLTTNAHGTLNLLEAMRQHGVKKKVLASTSSIYSGHAAPWEESMPVNTPLSPYAASKKAAEAMCHSYHYLFGLDVSVVRYFTVYGPCGRPDMALFKFIHKIDRGLPIQVYGDGSQTRDFTFVDDIARGTLAALKEVGYEVINIGAGATPVTLTRFLQLIEDGLGKKAVVEQEAFHPSDLKLTSANTAKAKRLLGWEPTVSIEEGILKTIAWHRENKDLLDDLQV